MKPRFVCILGLVYAIQSPLPAQSTDLFSGPNILSRGSRPIGFASGRPIRFRFYAGVGASYWTGLSSAATDGNGHLRDDSSLAGSASLGVYGARDVYRGRVDFSYQGNFQLFSKTTYYSGLNQALSLNFSRQLSRRTSFFLGAGAFSTATSLGLNRANFATSYYDAPIRPGTEIFDSPAHSVSANAGISHQLSSRWSIGTQASVFAMRRRSSALVNSNGFNVGGVATYMLSRISSISLTGDYGSYYFQRSFGESRIVNSGIRYGRMLSPRWQVSAGAGVFRVHSTRLSAIPVDPVIAALLGTFSVIEAVEHDTSGPSGSLSLSGSFRRSQVSFYYTRGVQPGNGLYLTSVGDTGGVNAVYTGIRRFSLYANAGVGQIKSVFDNTRNLPSSRFESAGGGTSFRIAPYIYLTANAAAGRFDLGSLAGRTRSSVSAGITFSPGEVPLILW